MAAADAEAALAADEEAQGGLGIIEEDELTPENLAATIYDTLGIDPHAAWKDDAGRPYHVYHADPIAGLI